MDFLEYAVLAAIGYVTFFVALHMSLNNLKVQFWQPTILLPGLVCLLFIAAASGNIYHISTSESEGSLIELSNGTIYPANYSGSYGNNTMILSTNSTWLQNMEVNGTYTKTITTSTNIIEPAWLVFHYMLAIMLLLVIIERCIRIWIWR